MSGSLKNIKKSISTYSTSRSKSISNTGGESTNTESSSEVGTVAEDVDVGDIRELKSTNEDSNDDIAYQRPQPHLSRSRRQDLNTINISLVQEKRLPVPKIRNKPQKAPKEQDLNPKKPKWQPMQMADPGEILYFSALNIE